MLAPCILVLAAAACSGRSVLTSTSTPHAGTALSPTPTVPPEDGTGDFRPLASCQDYQDDLAKILNRVDVVIVNNAPLQDYVSGKSGASCQLTANGTGLDFESPWAVADAVKEMLAGRGWQTDIRYQADGSTGTGVGFRKDNSLCLLSVNWQPSPDVDCPADWPLSACNLAPEQQLYEITLNCAQIVSSIPLDVPSVAPEVAEDEQNSAQFLKLTLRPAQVEYDFRHAGFSQVSDNVPDLITQFKVE